MAQDEVRYAGAGAPPEDAGGPSGAAADKAAGTANAQTQTARESRNPQGKPAQAKRPRKVTTATFAKMKAEGRKITMLTAYDYTTAKLVDESDIDGILVGDSLGMTMLGYDSTLPVTMEDMIHHGRAVTRGAKRALVVVDMPFMSYHTGVHDAVVNAGRLVQEAGATAVKLEGGVDFHDEIAAITRASIPVMAHLGLTPQSVNAFGGFKVQGRSEARAQQILDDARAIQDAGAFAVVLEGIPTPLAHRITQELEIPTIGIGAGDVTDGQILVYQDLLAMYEGLAPRFVRHYAQVGRQMRDAFDAYAVDVRSGAFPKNGVEDFTMDEAIVDRLR